MSLVLLVEDDVALRTATAKLLTKDDHVVRQCGTVAEALRLVRCEAFDCVLLDRMLGDGQDAARAILSLRAAGARSVILVTARAGELERIAGLDGGADDYVVKPYSALEVSARIRAVLRRFSHTNTQSTFGSLRIDGSSRLAYINDRPVPLTGLEHDLLTVLVRANGSTVRRDELRSLSGRGDVVVDDRNLDVHIHHLRRKLASVCEEAPAIITVRSVGYALSDRGSGGKA